MKIVVGASGFEPPTPRSRTECWVDDFRMFSWFFLDSGSNWVATESRAVPWFASHRRPSSTPPVA